MCEWVDGKGEAFLPSIPWLPLALTPDMLLSGWVTLDKLLVFPKFNFNMEIMVITFCFLFSFK